MLILAVALAYSATIPAVRRHTRRLTGPYPHPSTVSAWWLLFEGWAQGYDDVEAICILDDGSAVRGVPQTFNNSADDAPDRELVLRAPIRYRPPGDANMDDYDVSAVCVAASRIVALFVNYQQDVTSSREEGQAGEALAAEDPNAASAPL